MSKLCVAQLGHPVLREPTLPVPAEEILGEDFQRLLADMRETLRHFRGAGLAAPQVFSNRRVFIANNSELETFINPRIIVRSEEMEEGWEGCLSYNELLVSVKRHASIAMEYLDAEGKPKKAIASGFAARVLQHEYDHLDGILTLDRMSSPKCVIKASEAIYLRQKK